MGLVGTFPGLHEHRLASLWGLRAPTHTFPFRISPAARRLALGDGWALRNLDADGWLAAVRDPGRAMWTVYDDLDAFNLKHRSCGEVDIGVEGDMV